MNIFTSNRCEVGNNWMIGFFVILAAFLSALTAGCVNEERRRPHNSQNSPKGKILCRKECRYEKSKFNIKNTDGIDADSVYLFVFLLHQKLTLPLISVKSLIIYVGRFEWPHATVYRIFGRLTLLCVKLSIDFIML